MRYTLNLLSVSSFVKLFHFWDMLWEMGVSKLIMTKCKLFNSILYLEALNHYNDFWACAIGYPLLSLTIVLLLIVCMIY